MTERNTLIRTAEKSTEVQAIPGFNYEYIKISWAQLPAWNACLELTLHMSNIHSHILSDSRINPVILSLPILFQTTNNSKSQLGKNQHIYILYILFVFLDIDEEEIAISTFRVKDREKKLARLTGLGGIEICKASARPTVTTGEEQVEEGRKSRSM